MVAKGTSSHQKPYTPRTRMIPSTIQTAPLKSKYIQAHFITTLLLCSASRSSESARCSFVGSLSRHCQKRPRCPGPLPLRTVSSLGMENREVEPRGFEPLTSAVQRRYELSGCVLARLPA